MHFREVIRRSDRKILGLTITRDPPNATPLVDALRTRFSFRLRHRSPSRDDDRPSYDDDDDDDDDSECEDDFVWDVPNPFAPPDPSQAHIHALIQAEIARMRRYEMIGPLQSLPVSAQDDDDWDQSESESDDDDSEDSDADADADDEDSSDEDTDTPNTIVLPKLLHTHPLRYITSPHPLHAYPSPSPSPPSPPPPPSPICSSSDATSPDEDPTPWADLAQVYNDIAEAEERAARKAKRDTHRSRLKALAVPGHEASSAF